MSNTRKRLTERANQRLWTWLLTLATWIPLAGYQNHVTRRHSLRSDQGAMGPIMEVLLLFVVGLALLPVVNSFTQQSQTDKNATANVKQITTIVPVLFVICILVGAWGYMQFRQRHH